MATDIAAVTATTADMVITGDMVIAAGTAAFVPDGEAGIAMEADMPSGPEGVTLVAEVAWVADLAEASTAAVVGSTAVVADFMVAAVEGSTAAAATGKFQ